MYGHHIQQSMDQPSKVANPARGQLNRENEYFPVPFARENLFSRDGFSRPVSCQPAHSPHSGWIWCLLPGFLPISTAASIYLFIIIPVQLTTSRIGNLTRLIHTLLCDDHTYIQPDVIGSVPSLSGHAIACRWRSLPRVRRHRASSPQDISSNGCCLCYYHHGPINVCLSFPTHC